MSLDIGQALRDGLDRTTARNGLVLAAVFAVFRLVNGVVEESLVRVWISGFLDDLAADPPSLQGSDLTQQEFQDVIAEARDALVRETPLAYLDALSIQELFGIVLVLAVVAEALRIVMVRVFVSPETESIPGDLVTRNLLPAVANGILGGIAVSVLVGVGLLFLVVPGIFLFIAFLFVRQEIAVADKNFIEALSGSWNLTGGNRLELFGLIVFLAVIAIVVGIVTGLLGGSVPGAVISTAASAIILTYSVAVISRAYDQLRAGGADAVGDGPKSDDEPDDFDDIDDELLP